MSVLKKYYLLLRLSHWQKAIFVFFGVIYAGTSGYWLKATVAALAFCLVASAVYIYNDLQDIEEDKSHPQKFKRPLASGEISVLQALTMLVICLYLGFILAFFISNKLIIILLLYLAINLFYNHWGRKVIFLDVLCIASGFMLRIFAGTIGIGLSFNWWLTCTATLLSLFIALCKRRLEFHLGSKFSKRAVLQKYNAYMLDVLIASAASGCFISYLLYTIYAYDKFTYFIWTIPLPALGLWRFAQLTIKNGDNDDPISLFLSDNISLINLICFTGLTILALLYKG